MTKQEKIQEGIAQLIFDWTNCVKEDAADNYGLATKIITYLHSEGMVRKVDREPSDICNAFHSDECYGECMLATAVEPLIKEEQWKKNRLAGI